MLDSGGPCVPVKLEYLRPDHLFSNLSCICLAYKTIAILASEKERMGVELVCALSPSDSY